MATRGITLATNISSVADQPAQTWFGGRAVLVIEATTYPTTVGLQAQSLSGKWVPVNTSNITADGVYAFDVPAGQVRLHLTGGTASAIYAALVSVPYY